MAILELFALSRRDSVHISYFKESCFTRFDNLFIYLFEFHQASYADSAKEC